MKKPPDEKRLTRRRQPAKPNPPGRPDPFAFPMDPFGQFIGMLIGGRFPRQAPAPDPDFGSWFCHACKQRLNQCAEFQLEQAYCPKCRGAMEYQGPPRRQEGAIDITAELPGQTTKAIEAPRAPVPKPKIEE